MAQNSANSSNEKSPDELVERNTSGAERAGQEESNSATANAADSTSDASTPEKPNAPALDAEQTEAEDDQSNPFADYLANYIALNLLDRADLSRNLVDRAEMERHGRLPSKALYKSLGYRLRDSFVATPPPLQTQPMLEPEAALNAKAIEELEQSWALLDSTRERLNSQGIARSSKDDWIIALTRKNLLQEAILYWVQMGRQPLYNSVLAETDKRIKAMIESIAEARANYDVQDLRDRELALLDLRADLSALFQFNQSEEARLFNRINQRHVPAAAQQPVLSLQKRSSCVPFTAEYQRGVRFLQSEYPDLADSESMALRRAAYKINEVARVIAREALELHAARTRKIEDDYQAALTKAKAQREAELQALKQVFEEMVAAGMEIDQSEYDVLAAAPLVVPRANTPPSRRERALKAAIAALADMTANRLWLASQARLNQYSRDVFFDSKADVWRQTSADMRTLRTIVLDVRYLSLLDYLYGYERSAAASLFMLRRCNLHESLNGYQLGTNLQLFDQLAERVENEYYTPLNTGRLIDQYSTLDLLNQLQFNDEFGAGYPIRPVLARPPAMIVPVEPSGESVTGDAAPALDSDTETDPLVE